MNMDQKYLSLPSFKRAKEADSYPSSNFKVYQKKLGASKREISEFRKFESLQTAKCGEL